MSLLLYNPGEALMHRAQERLSAWTFVQAIRANTESELRALPFGLPVLRRPVGSQPLPNVTAGVM